MCGLALCYALNRRGIPFDCVDRNQDLGGNWLEGIYEGVHTITSRKRTGFSEFPVSSKLPEFISRNQMLDHLRRYADHFGLRRFIEFRKEVTSVQQAGRHWRVVFQEGTSRTYRGVFVVNGHHWDMRWPEIRGHFRGEYLHSRQYTGPEMLAGKRVVVVGAGNSACDVAVAAASVGAYAGMAVRDGHWFMPRSFMGIPLDDLGRLNDDLPMFLQRFLARFAVRAAFGSYERYGLPRPRHRILTRPPTVSTELITCLQKGQVEVLPNVKRFDERKVVFEDGREREADVVVCATGFRVAFPFLARELFRWEDEVPQLFHNYVSVEHPGLYVFGMFQPLGGAGKMISAGARELAEMARFEVDSGVHFASLLARLGVRAGSRMLIHPNRTRRRSLRYAALAGLLQRVPHRFWKRYFKDAAREEAAAPVELTNAA